MTYTEQICDLFSVPDIYFLAHCISADFAMGKGIVLEFNRRFDMKKRLKEAHPNYLDSWKREGKGWDCLLMGRVFNLITKERYFHKPTYDTLRGSLGMMCAQCEAKHITQVAMPVIGCGLDGLSWDRVSPIIAEVFAQTDVEILVCRQ